MNAKIQVFTLVLISVIGLQAQSIMKIHLNNGALLQIPMNTIDSITYSITNPGSLATIATISVSTITATTAVSGGNITNDGGTPVTQRGICFGTSPFPTTANTTIISGNGTGSFTSNLTGLTANTIYYVRAYAINSAGTAYGNELSFTTSSSNPNALDVIYITDSVLNDVYYHQTSYLNPTKLVFSNLKSVKGYIYFHQTNNIEEVEFPVLIKTGSYVYFHENLLMKKISAPNLDTIANYLYVYGNKILELLDICNLRIITCLGQEPYISITNNNAFIDNSKPCFTAKLNGTALTTTPITQFSRNTAIGGGTFTNTCSSPQGKVCWSTSPNPTSKDYVSNGSGSGGTFTANLTGLTPNTTYYVRAFSGDIYGDEVSFTTLP